MKTFLKCLIISIFLITTSALSNEAQAQDPQLERVQVFLIDQGYDLGNADGFMGPKTRAAIARFQLEKGLNITGEIDADTLAVIQKKLRFQKVRQLKKWLNQAKLPRTQHHLWCGCY